MSPDTHEKPREPPRFRAVLPPELEGLPDEPSEALEWEEIEARLEALEAQEGE
jgi:hypothetical protein